MSTRFAIFKNIPKLTEDGEVIECFEPGNSHTVVAFRGNNIGIYWKLPLEILQYIPDNTRVFPIDNTPQGIYTIGDIRKEIEKQEKNKLYEL